MPTKSWHGSCTTIRGNTMTLFNRYISYDEITGAIVLFGTIVPAIVGITIVVMTFSSLP